jgi:hypothetical protein
MGRKRVIDEVVVWRIFINTTAERAIDARVRIVMPGFSRLKSVEIDLIFATDAVGTCFSRRLYDGWIGVSSSVIVGRYDVDVELGVLAKSDAEAKGDCDAVCSAGVETEDRDGYGGMLEIQITPCFQIRSRITDLDRSRGRLRLWPNQELDEFEVIEIADVGVNETDKWRWTFDNFYGLNHLSGPGCKGEHAYDRNERSDQSRVHAAVCRSAQGKSNQFRNAASVTQDG